VTELSAERTSAEEIRRRYLDVDTANVSDVLDEMGLPNQGLSPTFAPFPSAVGKLAGWAFTIRGEMTPYPLADGDRLKMEVCAQLTPGSVAVWSGDGTGVCFFGELITIGMKERGCVGALVDGGVRDVAWIARQRFPVYARYRTPVQSISRWKVTAAAVPVPMPGATTANVEVAPGDFVLADEDGAIAIPRDAVRDVLERAEAIGAREAHMRAEISSGLSLSDALTRFGHV
jgi:4-hydroxy-4-methyl-2-oxoglutarate aldolase